MNIDVKKIRMTYTKGTRIKLIRMADIQAPPIGTIGTVQFVDDLGSIHMSWDNGGGLALIPGEDEFEIVK